MSKRRFRIFKDDSDPQATGDHPPVDFTTVLDAELDVFDTMARWRRGDRSRTSQDGEASSELGNDPRSEATGQASTSSEARRTLATNQRALGKDLVGLAFSGGGIRSATFNLGVLQALADFGLLRLFHYVSTVSGGGYIGSWLTALIHRENEAGPRAPGDPPTGIERVEKRLGTQRRNPSSEEGPEDSAVTFLRQYSNYLTPSVGLFTVDTWTVVAIYLRNLALNLLLLIPGLAALLLVPKLIISASEAIPLFLQAHSVSVFWPVVVVSLLLSVFATIVMGSSVDGLLIRRGRGKRDPNIEIDDLGQSAILMKVVWPLVFAAFLASRWLRYASDQWSDWMFWGAVALFSACAVSYLWALRSRRRPVQTASKGPEVDEIDYRGYHRMWWRLILTAPLVGAASGLLLMLCGQVLTNMDERSTWIWGTPLVLGWITVLAILHIGAMGLALRDFEREWLSRIGAWLLIVGAVWIGAFAGVVYGPVVFAGLKGWFGGLVVSGWAGSTLGGLLAARGRPENNGPSPLRSLALAIAPYVFVAGLLIVLAAALDMGVSHVVEGGASWADFQSQRENALERVKAFDRLDDAEQRSHLEPALWLDLYHGAPATLRSHHPELLLAPGIDPGAGRVWQPVGLADRHQRVLDARLLPQSSGALLSRRVAET